MTLPASNRSYRRQLVAVVLGYLAPSMFAIFYPRLGWNLGAARWFAQFIFGLAGLILIVLALRWLCMEPLRSLNLKPGSLGKDLEIAGILLTLYLYLLICYQSAPAVVVTMPAQAGENFRSLFAAMRANSLLLIFWLGPVTWISVAVYEETGRAFFLSRLWKVWPGPAARWLAVFFSALLFVAGHLYQGTGSAAAIGIMALVNGFYYLRSGRVWPLVLAHGSFDTLVLLINIILA